MFVSFLLRQRMGIGERRLIIFFFKALINHQESSTSKT